MVIDTKIMRFMKAAKVICSKNTVNKITGIAYNNQMIVATNCNAQLTYTSDEDRKDKQKTAIITFLDSELTGDYI